MTLFSVHLFYSKVFSHETDSVKVLAFDFSYSHILSLGLHRKLQYYNYFKIIFFK